MTSGRSDSEPSPCDANSAAEALDGKVQVRLLSGLAGIHRHEASLDEAGQLLADILHQHLCTPVVARWKLGQHQRYTWFCGDEQICRQMAGVDPPAPTESGDSTVHCLDDELGQMILDLNLGDPAAAQVIIATRTSSRTLDPADPFWNDLAIAAEGALQSARRLDQHREERVRLTAVVEQMPMGMGIFDLDGKIVQLNLRGRAMVERFSWTELSPESHSFELFDAQGSPLPHERWPLVRALHQGELVEEEEFILQFEDRRRHVSLSVLPILDDDEQVMSYLVMARDITHSSQAARRKDEFLSVASHELRSPLTPLAGLLRMSRKKAEASQLVEPQLLIRAETQVERLQRLIEGLLDVTRLESGQFPLERRPVNMNRLMLRILDPWLNGPDKERIELTLPDQPVMALVDPDRLDQVVTNIIDNAATHGREDGRIAVRLSADDDHLEITVRDEGDGMSQEVIDRVFERYFAATTENKSDKRGAGLGLYITRQLVEDHGGTIAIDSAPGQPTMVSIELPRHR